MKYPFWFRFLNIAWSYAVRLVKCLSFNHSICIVHSMIKISLHGIDSSSCDHKQHHICLVCIQFKYLIRISRTVITSISIADQIYHQHAFQHTYVVIRCYNDFDVLSNIYDSDNLAIFHNLASCQDDFSFRYL